nr:MAG TPA: Protein of unknown function (DUF551) [Caudoviricetes sp.]
MSHIKDRLSDYHDFMKKLVYDHQMILASDALEMIEQLQDDLEQDEKENGWIPVSERLPEIKMAYEKCFLVTDGRFCWMAYWTREKEWVFAECTDCKNKIDWTDVVAWRSLPEPYKEGRS